MNWRPAFEKARAELPPAPEHSCQVARKLMRDIAKMEASKAKREGRRALRAKACPQKWTPPEVSTR